MSDIEYVSIDRDELKRLQADSEELANLLAAQQQADPVTHSEDGREVVERYAIGFRRCSGFEHYCDAGMERDDAGEYMTVAQHERILKAKDAEIARVTVERNRLIGNARSVFKDMAEMALKQRDELAKELAALRAQPARQVGDVQLTGEYHADVNMLLERIPRQVGDEPIRDDDLVLVPRGLLGAARYAIKNKVDAPNVHGQLGEYCYGQAALAPAAVADEVIRQELEELKKWAIAQGRPKCGVKGCERLADSPWTNCREHWR